uniref:Uncharacterized protein n=1 Tax=Panagrolaimus davidi TaxID=227884 RepID=A0A914P2V2_9BILA
MLKAIDDTADAIKQIPRRSSTAAETKKQPRQKEKPQKSSRQLKQKLYSTAIVPTCSQRQPRQQCLRQCDGPCKTSLDVRHLTFFDICEHVACEQCLENAPRIEASIGGSGCPNLKCFLLDLASLCPGKKRCMATTHRECNLKECSRTSSAIESPSLNSSKKYTVTVTMSVKTTKK